MFRTNIQNVTHFVGVAYLLNKFYSTRYALHAALQD